MTSPYYKTIAALEKQGVAHDYILGWASGFLGSPKREEQRLTEPYQAGYADGLNKHTKNAANWKTAKNG